jgi:predicted ATPase/DNA-binding SARP family transcriptional activator/Flp pilus assembly protein TadD
MIRLLREFIVPPSVNVSGNLNMATLEMKFLGDLSIRQDGVPLAALKSKKGQALLCYLAVTGRTYKRPTLASLFWPEVPDINALLNLRKTLHLLNQYLSPFFVISRHTIALNQAATTWLDVAEFEARTSGQPDAEQLHAAAALYRGDFLRDFYLPDCAAFEEWASAHRAEYRRLALDTLSWLADHHLSHAQYEDAARYARRQLAMDDLRESAHRQLMTALARSGRRSEALVQFESCRLILAEALAVEPSPATARLAEHIRQDEGGGIDLEKIDLRGTKPAAAEQVQPPTYHNLPTPAAPFIGREAELSILSQYLSDPAIRLVTILGPGGVGKTRLALAAAEREVNSGHTSSFPDGVYYVSLASAATADLLPSTIAEAVGFHFYEGNQPKAQLLRYLRAKNLLLLLDNFEHLRDGVFLVDELMQTAPSVKLLVTSRERLNLQAEHLFYIGSLTLPQTEADGDADSSVDLGGYTAIQLFCQSARQVQPSFALTNGNRADVLAICRLVQGMPLGIVLAAPWLALLTPVEILSEMGKDLDFLATEMADVPARQRSLRAAFNHSWRLLNQHERTVFARLSVFSGGFSREAAQAVSGASLPDLQTLVNKSLLFRNSAGRCEVHELLRQFAAEQLRQAEEDDHKAHDRHSAYFCAFLQKHSEDWYTSRQLEALASVTQEADNIRQAWQWALVQEEWSRLLPAMDSWQWYHQWRLRILEFDAVCRDILVGTEKQIPVTPDGLRLQAKALTWLSWSTQNQSAALHLSQQALNRLEQPELAGQDTRVERALALSARAIQLTGTDNPQAVQQDYAQSLALFKAVDQPWGIAQSLQRLGMTAWLAGRCDLALEKVKTALTIRQKLGDLRSEAESKHGLGMIYSSLGSLDLAEQFFREALALGQQLGDQIAPTRYKTNLARLLLWHGNQEEAQHLAEESLALGQALAYPLYEAYARSHLGQILLHRGRYDRAREQVDKARFILNEYKGSLQLPDGGSLALTLAELALVESSFGQAESAFSQSQVELKYGWPGFSVFVFAGLGHTACGLGQLDAARRYLAAGLERALGIRAYVPAIYTLPFVAHFLTAAGRVERGAALWEQARTYPFVDRSVWFADLVGKRIEAVTAEFLSGRDTAVPGSDRTQDLWSTVELLLGEL